ncbi:MAG: hypothetical protein M3124_03920 [Actinomycetota bacterium]|nr:hypothetical protein [Actinomycetota bacterium]
MAAHEFEQQGEPLARVRASVERALSDRQPATASSADVDARIESLSKKLKALESRLVDSREASERIQERFIHVLEALDSRIASGRQATAARLESMISSIASAVEEIKGMMLNERKSAEENLWRGLGQLEAKISETGAETQHRLARAVATLSIAADEWRAAAPTLASKAEENVVDGLLALDAAVSRGQQSISEYLEKSIVQLSESINSWRAELEETTQRSQERIWNGLGSLEKRLNDQMRELEARIQERQMALVTLIIGGGSSGGLEPQPPDAAGSSRETSS